MAIKTKTSFNRIAYHVTNLPIRENGENVYARRCRNQIVTRYRPTKASNLNKIYKQFWSITNQHTMRSCPKNYTAWSLLKCYTITQNYRRFLIHIYDLCCRSMCDRISNFKEFLNFGPIFTTWTLLFRYFQSFSTGCPKMKDAIIPTWQMNSFFFRTNVNKIDSNESCWFKTIKNLFTKWAPLFLYNTAEGEKISEKIHNFDRKLILKISYS